MTAELGSDSWRTSLERLSDRPEIESLRAFLETLFSQRGDDVEWVVLYGSMARGDWSKGSDYDVLVGLARDESRRFIDRLGTFLDMSRDGRTEALPYTLDEIRRMFASFNLVVLAALRDGVVLFDRGGWHDLQVRFRTLLADGLLIQEPRGWSWTEEAETRLELSRTTG